MKQLKQSKARTLHVDSSDAMEALGAELGALLKPNSVLLLVGDLGAGKTTLVKGLVEAATGISRQEVTSPTFVYMNIYEGAKPVYHFDLYRLSGPGEFYAMGFDEYFSRGGICCIEWPERLEGEVPKNAIRIEIRHTETGRSLHIDHDHNSL